MSSPAAFITEDSGGFCCLEPCDRFLRCLVLYTPNIKGKHQQQQRERCTVLQETSATSLSRLQGTESGYQITGQAVTGSLSLLTRREVEVSREIGTLIGKLVYPKSDTGD